VGHDARVPERVPVIEQIPQLRAGKNLIIAVPDPVKGQPAQDPQQQSRPEEGVQHFLLLRDKGCNELFKEKNRVGIANTFLCFSSL